jgi:hypothetical protein
LLLCHRLCLQQLCPNVRGPLREIYARALSTANKLQG